MFHVVLGCFSWVFFYVTLRSQFRASTDLDEWDYFMNRRGQGVATYTHKRCDGPLEEENSDFEDDEPVPNEEVDNPDAEQGDDTIAEQNDEGTPSSHEEDEPLAKQDDESSNASEGMEEYIVTSDDETEKEAQPEIEEASASESEEESEDSLETGMEFWCSTPHQGMERFMEEIVVDLSEDERAQVESAINRVHDIMNPEDWMASVKTVFHMRSFSLTEYSERVRARLMAPAIWQDYSIGDREICEYLFASSIYRWTRE